MENTRNGAKGDQNKVWKILLPVVATIFLAIAVSMIVFDQNYYVGILYLITSILYFSSAYLITTGRVNMMKSSLNEKGTLALGFILLAIALALNGLFWGVGLVLFLAGILSIRKKSD